MEKYSLRVIYCKKNNMNASKEKINVRSFLLRYLTKEPNSLFRSLLRERRKKPLHFVTTQDTKTPTTKITN